MKKQIIKIPGDHPLSQLAVSILVQRQRIADREFVVKAVTALIRNRLQAEHPEINWALVHDLNFQAGEIELITYDHPMEKIIGPMAQQEIEQVEQARAEMAKHGLIKKQQAN